MEIPEDVIHFSTGLIKKSFVEGEGYDKPGPEDQVQGSLRQVRSPEPEFAETEPTTILLNELNPGLSEAFQTMSRGSKARLWVPWKLLLDAEKEGIEQDGYRVYDLQLVDFTRLVPKVMPPDDMISPSLEDSM